MTEKQKLAVFALNEAKQNKAFDDEEYLLLLEFVIGNQQPQVIPCPIETPVFPSATPWVYPWVTYQTISTQQTK